MLDLVLGADDCVPFSAADSATLIVDRQGFLRLVHNSTVGALSGNVHCLCQRRGTSLRVQWTARFYGSELLVLRLALDNDRSLGAYG